MTSQCQGRVALTIAKRMALNQIDTNLPGVFIGFQSCKSKPKLEGDKKGKKNQIKSTKINYDSVYKEIFATSCESTVDHLLIRATHLYEHLSVTDSSLGHT